MTATTNIQATGKRKSAIARVYLRPGNGRIVEKQKAFEEYFPMEKTHNLVRQPFNLFQSGTIYSHHATGLVYAPFQFLIVSFINLIDP